MSRLASSPLIALLAFPILGVGPGAAQYLGGGTKTAQEVQLADLAEVRDKFLSLGAAFPEDTHDWRPMVGVRSVRDVLVLIAAEGTLFPTLWGYDPPAWIPDPSIQAELARLEALPFDDLLAEMSRSFQHTLELVRAMDEESRGRRVSFFGLQAPLESAVTLMVNDMHEHLGQLIAYARMNGVVPPWSRVTGQDEARANPCPRPGDIFVTNLQTNDVAWFEGRTGEYRGAFVQPGAGGLQGGTGLAFGPDGDLYVSSSQNHRILRYDGTTGEPAGIFVADDELRSPFSLIFGPDGDLYVSSGTGHRVLRYDGGSGDFIGVAAQGDGLQQPIGLAFGPDGMLYVINSVGRNVMRFDPTSGQSRGVFATDSLRFPSDLAFGPDGDLYVTSAASSTVVRFDGSTGAFIEIYARLPGKGGVPVGIRFEPEGAMLVTDFGRGRLYRAETGGAQPHLLSDDGLARPENLALMPDRAATRRPVEYILE